MKGRQISCKRQVNVVVSLKENMNGTFVHRSSFLANSSPNAYDDDENCI